VLRLEEALGVLADDGRGRGLEDGGPEVALDDGELPLVFVALGLRVPERRRPPLPEGVSAASQSLRLAAGEGAGRCFKSLVLQRCAVDEGVAALAVEGGCVEAIHIREQRGARFAGWLLGMCEKRAPSVEECTVLGQKTPRATVRPLRGNPGTIRIMAAARAAADCSLEEVQLFGLAAGEDSWR
jgi:hypothetical protein